MGGWYLILEIEPTDLCEQNPVKTIILETNKWDEQKMLVNDAARLGGRSPSPCWTRGVLMVLLVVLSTILVPVHVAGQLPAAIFVTYVSAAPACPCDDATVDGRIQIVFRVVLFSCEAYYGTISYPAVGIKSATFLLVSVETQQTREYLNTSVYPGAVEGEYRAQIQIPPTDLTGRLWVYVKGGSLQLEEGLKTGPPNNTSSEQTDDTSDWSMVQIGKAPSPSFPIAQQLQGNELLLIMLGIIIALLLLLVFARRKKPTSVTLIREPYGERPRGRRPRSR